MKKIKILRIFGLALVFSLFMALLPATPVFAYDYDISISPVQGMVGATITISGSDFSSSTDANEKRARIFFSPISVSTNTLITAVATYEMVEEDQITYTDDTNPGEFSTTFVIPSVLDDGVISADVVPGTYYIYVTVPTQQADSTIIRSKATFTVTQGATLDALSPTSGPPGTDVMVSGFNFPASTALVFKFDGVAITPKSGDTSTRSSGLFITTITIPATATAGTHVIGVVAGTAGANANFSVSASPSLSPLSPASGPPGTDIVITGNAFPPNTALVFKFDTTTIVPKSGATTTTSTGGFMNIITVPSTATNGVYLITVTAGSVSLTASFAVTGASPTTTPPPTTPPATTPPDTTTPPPSGNPSTTIRLAAAVDYVGSQANFIGMDFTPGANVLFTFDETAMTTVTADGEGVVLASFILPPAIHGEHTITATDGVNSDSITFIVESVPPVIPQPTDPGMGARVKAPVTFDWSDVTDASNPVTYSLQISDDDDFAPDSILIDKAGLTSSEYTLTDEELAKLDDPEATYYWREQAVDAAQNESGWTGAGEFTVAQPFKFAGWPLYLTIGIGAVLFFLLGLWIGRRTAFYY